MSSHNLANSAEPFRWVADTASPGVSWPKSGDLPKLTTIDVARVLHMTSRGVRKLVRAGTLVAERTRGGKVRGQYLFRSDDVEQLAKARVTVALTLVKPRMLRARHQPRQLTLFGLYRRRGPQPFRPDVYGSRSGTETAADYSGIRKRVRR
jgi:hypothetical protein